MDNNKKKKNLAVLLMLVCFSAILFITAFLRVNGGAQPELKKSAFLGFKDLFSSNKNKSEQHD